MAFLGLNGGPHVLQAQAVSFLVDTDYQAETDGYWNAVGGNRGVGSACGCCKDHRGVNWHITPHVLIEAISSADAAIAARVFRAITMMQDRRRRDQGRHRRKDRVIMEKLYAGRSTAVSMRR
ncbi:VOC family protein [Sphingomonas sp. Leaf38]|uniref:VOC family protein n=1 Tax=Sphingomonas sp. Leaf38 TaxID=1736217 RepID=UPI000B252640|nr:VOC family protein [Sphingomonas sp. Leaf38]